MRASDPRTTKRSRTSAAANAGPGIRFQLFCEGGATPSPRHMRMVYTDGAMEVTGLELRRRISEALGLPFLSPFSRRPAPRDLNRIDGRDRLLTGYVHLFHVGARCGEAVEDNEMLRAFITVIVKRHPDPWNLVRLHRTLVGATPPPGLSRADLKTRV